MSQPSFSEFVTCAQDYLMLKNEPSKFKWFKMRQLNKKIHKIIHKMIAMPITIETLVDFAEAYQSTNWKVHLDYLNLRCPKPNDKNYTLHITFNDYIITLVIVPDYDRITASVKKTNQLNVLYIQESINDLYTPIQISSINFEIIDIIESAIREVFREYLYKLIELQEDL